jgi:hypothetical protein
MSNTNQDWYDEEDFDNVSDNEQYSGDDVLKKVRRSERAKDKRVKELEAELESLRSFQRETLVSKVLSEKGINPKVAKFVPSNLEVSAETISAWLDENGEIFGFAQQSTSAQPAVDPNDLAALRQIDAVTSGALSPEFVNDAASMISNASSAEELLDFLYSQGAE